MKRLACYCFYVLALVQVQHSQASSVEKSNECSKMVLYALSKHDEYSNGKKIPELLSEVEHSKDNEKQKFYKSLVVEILDTFAVWNDPVEKERVNNEISDHFNSICDAEKIKGIFP